MALDVGRTEEVRVRPTELPDDLEPGAELALDDLAEGHGPLGKDQIDGVDVLLPAAREQVEPTRCPIPNEVDEVGRGLRRRGRRGT